MATQIGTVGTLSGKVTAISIDGTTRELKAGDAVFLDEKIVTAQGARVTIIGNDSTLLEISQNQTVALDINVMGTDLPTAADSALQPATSDTIIDALNRGDDLSTTLDATAAGAGAGGGEGGGSSFVQLARIVESVNGNAYRYGFEGLLPPEIVEGIGQAEEEDDVLVDTEDTPVDDTPVLPPVDDTPVLPPVEPPVPKNPTVVVTKEYRTEVATDVKTETVVGSEYETGRTVTTNTTEEEQEDGTLKTTTTTTVVSYDKETNTITTTTTTNTTYVRDVTTTTAGDGTATVAYSDWSVDKVETTDKVDSVKTYAPREETQVDTKTDFIAEPEDPTVVVTKEYRTEVTTDVKTEKVVGEEYETGRTTTTKVTEEEQEDGTLKTTTTTTVISFNTETKEITTTTTTTTTYVRDVTTTTAADGTVTVEYRGWTVDKVDTDTESDTVTTNAPREETIVDTNTDFIEDEEDDSNGDGNNGHGNNTDGQDDNNPGQGGGGPNSDPKDGDDEDEGGKGNQGDNTPGAGGNDNEDPEKEKQNNGIGNGDQDAPGGSLDNNNAENDQTPDSNGKPIIDDEEGIPMPGGKDKEHQDNGWGNGDDDAPGGSLDNNNAENNNSGLSLDPKDLLKSDDEEILPGNGNSNSKGKNADAEDLSGILFDSHIKIDHPTPHID